MSDFRTAAHRKLLMDRHARIAVLIDRLQSTWRLAVYEDLNGDLLPVDDAWEKELVAELEWLHALYGEALANEGDVRRVLMPPPAPPSPVAAPTASGIDVSAPTRGGKGHHDA